MKRILATAAAIFALSPATQAQELNPLNTWDIKGYAISGEVAKRTLRILGSELPTEWAVCFTGRVQAHPKGGLALIITDVFKAEGDSASTTRFWATTHPSGCRDRPGLVASGHSHPFTSCASGDVVSADDLLALNRDKRLLAGSVWCYDGRMIMYFRDGRRYVDRYVRIYEGTLQLES